MTRSIPDVAVAFVKQHEGCKLTAYQDTGGVYTIGVGHTGPEVVAGLTITQRQADLYLRDDLATAARRLSRVVNEPTILALTDNQYAALLSFVFNVGCQPSWTIWKKLNAQDFDAIPGQLLRFCFAGGKKVQGLVNRRTAEIRLWSTEEPGCVSDVPSSAVTRFVETPPAPAEKPKQGHVVAAAIAGAGGLAEGAKQVTALVQPYADKSETVMHMLSIAATVGAGAAVAVAGLMWLQAQQAKR